MRWILKPSYWIMIGKYDREYNRYLNKLMVENKFEYKNRFTAKLGDTVVWIENHPYGSFTPDNGMGADKIRPSRSTVYRAWRKLHKDIPNFWKLVAKDRKVEKEIEKFLSMSHEERLEYMEDCNWKPGWEKHEV